MAWLTREGQVLASAEVASTRAQRRRGAIGRESLSGVLVIPARSVHTFGVRFALDVAFCDGDGTVIRVLRLKPNRVTMPVWKARTVIETESGAFHEWGLVEGDRLEIR